VDPVAETINDVRPEKVSERWSLQEHWLAAHCNKSHDTNNKILSETDLDQSIRIHLIDFDMSGRIGEATYPPYLNSDIDWQSHG
jgi:hypothetical protein